MLSKSLEFEEDEVLSIAIVASVSPSCVNVAASSASSSSFKKSDNIFAIEVTEYV